MRFFDAGSHAFDGLSYLHIECVTLSINDMANVLDKCNKLQYLSLHRCDCGTQSVLNIEHAQLTTLKFSYCGFETVQLTCLPRLISVTCQAWTASENQYPLSFGYVPQLSKLILRNGCTILHKVIQLSEFLSNLMIYELDLDFACERVSHKSQHCTFIDIRLYIQLFVDNFLRFIPCRFGFNQNL